MKMMMDTSFNLDDDIEIPSEIKSIDEYDKKQAKLQASLLWTLNKAYNGNIPHELKQLFYEDQAGSWFVQPRVVNFLTSGQAYCMVCANCFQDSAAKWQDHSSVIQALSRKGIYVLDESDTPITETNLIQTSPFQPLAHVAMMDALMRGYAHHVISVQSVVSAVRKFAPVVASSELPDDIDGAMVFWVNKVCLTVKSRLEDNSELVIPLVENLVRDVGDCCCLATLISFYCPELLHLNDISLTRNVAIADSLYNISLVKKFCASQLPHTFHFSYNDLLYTNTALTTNLVAFLAELFVSFQVKRIPCVSVSNTSSACAQSKAAKVLSNVPPISAATKRSFHQLDDAAHSNPDVSVSSRQTLLEKRALLYQTDSCVNSPPPGAPMEAWLTNRSEAGETCKETKPSASDSVHRTYTKSMLRRAQADSIESRDFISDQSQSTSRGNQSAQSSSGQSVGSLLTNVSLDSDLSVSLDDEVRMSMDSEDTDVSRPSSFKEPLIPAKLKPAKEKSSNHNKEVESGEKFEKSPTSPARVTRVNRQCSSSDEEFATPSASGQSTPFSGSPQHYIAGLPAVNGDTSEVVTQAHVTSQPATAAETTTAPSGQTTARRSATPQSSGTQSSSCEPMSSASGSQSNGSEAMTSQSTSQSRGSGGVSSPSPHQMNGPGVSAIETSASTPAARSEGFFIDPASSAPRSATKRKGPTTQTFTQSDRRMSQEEAQLAGIPVIADAPRPSTDTSAEPQRARNDSRSSGEFSDHESSKIHKDHKSKEGNAFFLLHDSPRTDGLFNNKTNLCDDKVSPTTSFAAIKKQREAENGESVVYTQYGSEIDSPVRTSLKTQFQKAKLPNDVKKKTTFAALPNQTTWQENVQKMMQRSDEKENEANGTAMSASDMSTVRLKLEAKRKMMELEKKKAEAKLASQRQKLGKEAFLQVVAKKERPVKIQEEGQGDVKGHAEVKARAEERRVHNEVRPEVVAAEVDGREGRKSSEPARRFSREDIQHKIDGVKQRWFKNDRGELVESTGDYNDTQKEPRSGSDSRSNPSEPRSDSYDSSFERLNASLSDLQGEIMKLNLQQEQITKTITTPRTQAQEVPAAVPLKPPDPFRAPQYPPYTMPHAMAHYGQEFGAPGVNPALVPGMNAQMFPGMAGYPPSMPPGPGPYMSGQYPGMYPNQQMYGGMYQRPYYQGQGHIPGGHVPAMGYPVSTAYHATSSTFPLTSPGGVSSTGHVDRMKPHQESPSGGMHAPYSSPNPALATGQTASTHAHPHSQASVSSSVHPSGHGHSLASDYSPTRQMAPHSTTGHTAHDRGRSSDSAIASSVPSRSIPEPTSPSTPSWANREPQSPSQYLQSPKFTHSRAKPEPELPSPETDDLNVEQTGGGGSFVITFDSGTPKRSKPKLKAKAKPDKSREQSAEREDATKTPVPKSSEVSPTPLPAQVHDSRLNANSYTISEQPSTPEQRVDRPDVKPSPASKFVIEIDASQKEEEEDLLRKKEKILQMAMKRQADLEKKRAEKDRAQEKAKEEKRLQQELAEQKKLEEKARRAEIFQAYKTKKQADEEDTPPSKASQKPNKPRSGRNARATPAPLCVVEDKQSVCSSQGSQEDLHHLRPSSPSSNASSRKGSAPNNLTFAKDDSSSRDCVSYGRRGDSPGQLRSGLYRSQSGNAAPPSPLESRRGFQRPPIVQAGQGDNGQEYSGPKLFVKPKSKSNRTVIQNALSHCCLAGVVSGEFKDKVLDEMARCESNYYLILFRDGGCQFRALYKYNPDIEEVVKLIGSGPKQITSKMLEKFYKYNSGSKSFSEIATTKHLSVSIDAVTIQGHLWNPKRPVSQVLPTTSSQRRPTSQR